MTMARRAVKEYIADPYRDSLENPLYCVGLHKAFLERLLRIETVIGVPKGQILEEVLTKYSRIMSLLFHPDIMSTRLETKQLPYEVNEMWKDISELVQLKDTGASIIEQLISLMPGGARSVTERVVLRVVEGDNTKIKKAYDALVKENQEAREREQGLRLENTCLKRQAEEFKQRIRTQDARQVAALSKQNTVTADLEARIKALGDFNTLLLKEKDELKQTLDEARYEIHRELMKRQELEAPEKYTDRVYGGIRTVYREALVVANKHGANLVNEWKSSGRPSKEISTKQFLRYVEERDSTGKMHEYFIGQARKIYTQSEKIFAAKRYAAGLDCMRIANLLDPTESYVSDALKKLIVR